MFTVGSKKRTGSTLGPSYRTIKRAKTSTQASKTKSLTSKVNKLIRNQEMKFRDALATAAALTTTGTQTSITGQVAQGDDTPARDGRYICCKYLHIHGYISQYVGTTGVRYLVYLDKQANAVAPAVTDILVNATPIADGMVNFVNRDRFKILFDSYGGSNCQSMGDATSTVQNYYFDKYIPLNDLQVSYASNTTAEAITNAIGTIAVGPVSGSVRIDTRLAFIDA